MRTIIILISLTLAINAYAYQNIFYCPDKNLTITDVSGKKTTEEIREEFNLYDESNNPLTVETITIENKIFEAGKIENGKLIKYNYKIENTELQEEKNAQIKKDKKTVLDKLNLTEEEAKLLLK